jgi:hypothetical protein
VKAPAPTRQIPAVRQIKLEGHTQELIALVQLFLAFSERESGPATRVDG